LAIEKVAELVLFFEKENYLKKDEFTFFISSSTKEWFYAIDDPLYILFLQRLTKEWDISQISDLLYSFSLDDDESTWDTNNPQFISFLLDFTKDWDNKKKIEFIDSLAEEWDWDDELVEKLKIVLKNDLTIEKEKIEETVTKVQVSSEVTDQTKETNIISEKSSNKKKKKKKKKKKNI
jgi:ribosomal protein L21